MGEADERLCDGVAEDQGLLTARSKLNGHMAQCEAAAFHRSPSIDRWDDATGSNLHEHLAGVNDPLRRGRSTDWLKFPDTRSRSSTDIACPRRRGDRMRRREFITLLGGAAAAWPLAARAQQPIPVVGFLHPASPDAYVDRLRAFRQGLKEAGFIEGENAVVEYRWADNQPDRLSSLASELVRKPVAVIVTSGGTAPALAAKTATSTIPIVFTVPEDPVRLGLVASLARPGGNATGVNFFSDELVAKRLELLRELVPAASRVAVLLDPANAGTMLQDVEAAARRMGVQIQAINVSTSRDIEIAFAALGRDRPDALFVTGGPLLQSRRMQLALLAARHAIPTSYGSREYPEVGGLMSYGASLMEAHRQAGLYAGRILKGASPTDLPVMQATKFELVINLIAAKTLGLDVPSTLLARADEVIE